MRRRQYWGETKNGVKLLVVDDDHDVRGVVASFLVDAGYAVLEAEDGQAALTLLTDDPSLRMLISDIRNAWDVRR
jgi:CheY-like chemotaxis protein